MGYKLRRDLREVLGSDVTGLQRAVALEIADDADEETRISWVTLEELVRWTGAKDGAVVRNALKRLAGAGWEFRVPIGTGKDGRVLYAKPGVRMTFLVPDFTGGATAPSEGAVAPSEGAVAPSEGAVAPSEGDREGAVAPSQGAVAPSQGAVAPSQGAVAPPSSSPPHLLTSSASQQAEPASERHGYGIPDAARPLVDALTAAGVIVRWPFKGDEWFPLLSLIEKSGVTALVQFAAEAASSARNPVQSAKYFMGGWKELPPLPPPGTPQYRPPAPSSGYQPFQCPPEEAYENDLGF